MTGDSPSARRFPIEALVAFPVAGPLAFASGLALLYGAALMVFLNPAGLIAAPAYFIFWLPMFFKFLAPPLFVAGALYAVAVRAFAPPEAVTALVCGLVAGAACAAALPLVTMSELPISEGAVTLQVVVLAAAMCGLLAIPGWWLARRMQARFGRESS